MAELNEVKNYIMQMTYFLNVLMFNPIQDKGGGTKGPPYQFFLSNFYKRRSFPCNFYKRRN